MRPSTRAALIAALFSAPLALAGPIWDEPNNDDAGDLPTGAQEPGGALTIERIRGNLFGNGPGDGGGDFQDMYKIFIAEPSIFFASTSGTFGGDADFDTMLFLFDKSGAPVLANDNFTASPNPGGSHLPAFADDGTPSGVTTPGIYFLAISGFPSVPVDALGAELFLFGTPSEVSGPDGSTEPIAAWSGPGAIGEYEIVLSGVVPVPAPGAALPLLLATSAVAARRHR